MEPADRAKRIITGALRSLFTLTLRSKSKSRKGVIVSAETLHQTVNLWLDCGMDVEHADFKAATVAVITKKPTAPATAPTVQKQAA